jgi:hypothetical protein
VRIHLPLIALPLLALAACGGTDATITYHQVGACNGGVYTDQSGNVDAYSAGPQQAYVIFAIENIDNSQVTSSWTAQPTNFFVNSGIKDSFDPTLTLYAQKLGPFAMVSTTIPAGANYGFSPYAYGAVVVQTSAADGASEADTTKYNLLYTPTGPGVILSQNPPASQAYTPDCATVTLK